MAVMIHILSRRSPEILFILSSSNILLILGYTKQQKNLAHHHHGAIMPGMEVGVIQLAWAMTYTLPVQ